MCYDKGAFRKEEVFILKSELKTFAIVAIVSTLIVGLYTIYLNSTTKYNMNKINSSMPNNIAIGEVKTEYLNTVDEEPVEEPVREVVYDDMTLDELSEKLNRSLNSTIAGKGYLIASYSLEHNVDPYMATAIILHETGCKWECSYLVKACNNVGGQKGSGCGSYSYFDSLDGGIMAFIDNLERNYINYGLTTPEAINTKYASDQSWAGKVYNYIEIIKAQ